jgi:pimeloyl-ACP methyl ester carboxylesterase
MKPVLLIHGSCHGAWCWRDVLPILNKYGDARAIDLPGAGSDKTPIPQITMDHYIEAILDAVTEPTLLVGHSMAGFPIAAAAERAPEKIARLIFVCAYVPRSGLSMIDMRRAAPEQPLREAIETAADRQSYQFRPDMVEAKFYHDCPPGTLGYARPLLTAQAILPQATPITLSDTYARIEKRYIRCTQDQAIPPAYQTVMSQGLVDTVDLHCGHSPFFAQPDALAKHIMR